MTSKFCRWAGLVISLGSFSLVASQRGPSFPTHRFPTDQSFHLSYEAGLLSSDHNFVDQLLISPLTAGLNLQVWRQQVLAEFQPNRRFSAGAYLNYDSLSLTTVDNTHFSQSAFSDQWFFGEYRMLDYSGASLGLSFLAKVPAYSNPTLSELQNPQVGGVQQYTALLGDAQSDYGALLTTELWPSNVIRLRADGGFLYRTEEFAAEIPVLLSLGFVTPKVDLDLKVDGNFSVGNDHLGTDHQGVKKYFPSDYALSQNSWILRIHPTAELWVSKSLAVTFEYAYSWMGANAPAFNDIQGGLRYRWASTRKKTQKTFEERDMNYDQSQGVFDGESQESKL